MKKMREPFDLFDNVIGRIKKYLPAEAGALLLLDPSRRFLEFRATFGPKAGKLKRYRMPAKRGVSGEVVRRGTVLLVNDVSRHQQFDRSVDHDTGFRTRQILAAPVRVHRRTVGVLELLNKRKGRFDDLDRKLLVVLTNSLGRFLESVQVAA